MYSLQGQLLNSFYNVAGEQIQTEYPISKNTDGTHLLIDCGRKYFTVAQLKQFVDLMFVNGMKYLHLHFAEDNGIRIESERYPWLMGSDATLLGNKNWGDPNPNAYLTKTEAAQVVRYAQSKGIEVIPEIDSPGHSALAIKRYYEQYGVELGAKFKYNGTQGNFVGSLKAQHGTAIDLANTMATNFVKNIYTEYATFFYDLGCRSFNICADEIMISSVKPTGSPSYWDAMEDWQAKAVEITGDNTATAYDLFVWWIAELKTLLENIGYTDIYAFDDCLYLEDTVIPISTDIEVICWQYQHLKRGTFMLNKGHKTIAMTINAYYYVLRDNFDNPTVSKIENFNPLSGQTSGTKKPEAIGFAIWCDNPAYETVLDILTNTTPLIQAFTTRTVGVL